jgi:hypothetical protein
MMGCALFFYHTKGCCIEVISNVGQFEGAKDAVLREKRKKSDKKRREEGGEERG